MTSKALRISTEEQELTNRVREGDAEAFRILFERYRLVLYRFCNLMVNDRAAAEDIYQETFIVFYETCCKGEKIQNVRGYLITIARNRCLNLLRDRQRSISLEEEAVLEMEAEYDLNNVDMNDILRSALLEIPEQYRESFLLFELEGYSYTEIAEYCDVDRGTVRNRIYRAKQSLRKILGPIMRDEKS